MAKRFYWIFKESKSVFEDDRQTKSFQQSHDSVCITEYYRDGYVQMGFRSLIGDIYKLSKFDIHLHFYW